MRTIKYSIIIPTYNHLEDCLKPCIDSIVKYTSLDNVEIIVVANGCIDETESYLDTLNPSIFRKFVFAEPLGYTKATNYGITNATGEYVILLNNDTILLEQPKNLWLNFLETPFMKETSVGITGPLKLTDPYIHRSVIIFFCAMIPRNLFLKFGLLDEIFSPGGGEDIDFTMRLINNGYKCLQVPSDDPIKFNGTNSSIFPIWHQNNKTFGEISEYGRSIIKRNGFINLKRYNKQIKLNLGSGYVGLHQYGFVSIDDKVPSAELVGDILELDFDNNSVQEIYGGHFINHLDYDKAVKTIKRLYDLLKPGGLLRLEQPDMGKFCKEYIETQSTQSKISMINRLIEPMTFNNNIYSSKSFWDEKTLKEHLESVGFSIIIISNQEMIHRDGLNFRIEAIKPL